MRVSISAKKKKWDKTFNHEEKKKNLVQTKKKIFFWKMDLPHRHIIKKKRGGIFIDAGTSD